MDYRHDKAAFEDDAPKIFGILVLIEVYVVAEPEGEKQHGDDEADEDHPEGILDAGDIGFLRIFVRSGLCSGFHGSCNVGLWGVDESFLECFGVGFIFVLFYDERFVFPPWIVCSRYMLLCAWFSVR